MTIKKAQVSHQPEAAGTSPGGGRIVVGVDGSPGSLAALRWALSEASLRGVNVPCGRCLAGMGDMGYPGGMGGTYPTSADAFSPEDALGAALEATLAAATAPAAGEEAPPAATVTVSIVEGDPATELQRTVGDGTCWWWDPAVTARWPGCCSVRSANTWLPGRAVQWSWCPTSFLPRRTSPHDRHPGTGGRGHLRGTHRDPRGGSGRVTALGLPDRMRACLFDLDGVLTQTAKVHAAAWKEMFDACLRARARVSGEPFVAFDPVGDYDAYVDGKPRADGTRSFLTARGIELPEGSPDDPPVAETVQGLGNRKNEIVLRRIREDGVQAYAGSVRYVRAAREASLHRAVVSSSTNCADVLLAAGIEDLFEERVDGLTAEREHLAGKPAPDMFLAAAQALGVAPADAVVFEDALAGVAAGRAGGFGFVVGVDRAGQAVELTAHGADIVVTDVAELLEAS